MSWELRFPKPVGGRVRAACSFGGELFKIFWVLTQGSTQESLKVESELQERHAVQTQVMLEMVARVEL